MPQDNNSSLSEQQKFLQDLEHVPTAPLERGVSPEKEITSEPVKPEKDEEGGNRAYRRLQAKYQAERESSIRLAERLQALEDAKAATKDDAADYLKKVERIYGSDSPEASAATELLKTALMEVKETAKMEALEALRAEQAQAQQSVAKEEETLDAMIEEIEDENNVTLDDQTKKGFFQLLEKLSPKDREGNIVAFADHHAVWEELQARKQQAQGNRAKDLASRSMVKSGTGVESNLQEDVMTRYLKDNGLI